LLHATGDAQAAQIVVSDNGQGMDEAAKAAAFDRFSQFGETQSGENALGLGLPLARQFVEAHGGTLTLISEAGEGTVVSVHLPR
jgi:signal transduction histidine kinase